MPSDHRLKDGWRASFRALFSEREIFLRSGGETRFLRLSSRLQFRVAALLALVLLGWAAITLVMLARHAQVMREQAQIAREKAVVERRSAKVDAYSRSAANVARDLEQRQRLIEELVKTRIGPVDMPEPAAPAPAAGRPAKIGYALPDAAQMHRLEQRQDGFALALAAAFDARSERTADALRSLGLNPDAILKAARTPIGWPPRGETLTPALRTLAVSVERLGVLEDNLIAIPSGMPTPHAQMVTSSFGVRRDPFTGAPAFHPGLDFVGRYGQPIVAAADGKVSFVGDRSGYGHVVEIDHGNGLMTRYAHLSGWATRVGTDVHRGDQIARMGSTGRSTGTHLHFEVRFNGNPLNPRRFLEASREILDVQHSVAQRLADTDRRG